MKRNHVIIRIIVFSVIISIILFTSGCIGTLKSNATGPQTLPPESYSPLPTQQQPPVSVSETQNQTVTTSIPAVTITPHFSRTITYGSNRSSALTEDQAWRSADAFFEKHGIRDILPSEIEPLGQNIWTYENNTQTVEWSFQVNRLISGVNHGGIITIDAYDGHVISMGWFE